MTTPPPSSTPTDDAHADLCRRLKASDRAAFEQVFRLFRDDLLRFVWSIVSRGGVAHDLVQDVFVSLWDRRTALDPTLSLKAYLYRMARNRAYRHLRDTRTHAEKHAEIQQDQSSHTEKADSLDLRLDAARLDGRLRRWIDELPERQREALLLSRYHGLSHRDVASVMDVSPRTVNNHIVRALTHLQNRVQAFEPTLLET